MNDYLDLLIKQYIAATGIKRRDFSSSEFYDNFYKWLGERRILGEFYLKLLREHCDINGACAEVGKGIYDTIVPDTNCTIITQYNYDLNYLNNNVIKGSIQIIGKYPRIIKNGRVRNSYIKEIERFITQNPYSYSLIRDWYRLSSNDKNISIGMYGLASDLDYDEKMQQLYDLKRKLCGNFDEWFTMNGQEYYYGISTTKKLKR